MFRNIKLYLMICSFCGLYLYSCSQISPVSPQQQPVVTVAASVQSPDQYFRASALDSMILLVSGESIEPVRTALIIDGVKASTQLQVSGGDSLHFSVIGYTDSTEVLRGDTTLVPSAGKKLSLAMKLNYLVSTIITTPPDTVVQKNEEIAIVLQARGVTDLGTFGAEVHYDPEVLQVVGLYRQDEFLKMNSGSVMQMSFNDEPETGVVKIILGIFPASAAVSGNGPIAKLLFKAVQVDTTQIMIKVDNQQDSDLGMFNSSADLIYSLGLGSRICIQDSSVAE